MSKISRDMRAVFPKIHSVVILSCTQFSQTLRSQLTGRGEKFGTWVFSDPAVLVEHL